MAFSLSQRGGELRRILTGRAGASYRTETWIELRSDHAAARDAVFAPLDIVNDLGEVFVAHWKLFEVTTLAQRKTCTGCGPIWGGRYHQVPKPSYRAVVSPGSHFKLSSPMVFQPRQCEHRCRRFCRCSRKKPTGVAGTLANHL